MFDEDRLGQDVRIRQDREHAEKTAKHDAAYEFTRTKITKIFDSDHKLESSEQEVFRMLPVGGTFEPHLISKDGKPVSKEQAAKEAQDEGQANTGGKKSPQDESMTRFLKSEVAQRFSYDVIGEEKLAGRPAYVVRFVPRPELAAHGIEEKVMARIAGKLWVDKEEFEVVRIDSGMTRPLRICTRHRRSAARFSVFGRAVPVGERSMG